MAARSLWLVGGAALAVALFLPGPAAGQVEAALALKKGIELRKAERYTEAVAALEDAVARAPTWAVARLELARALLDTGAAPSAIAPHLEAARRSDPDNPRLYYLLGLLEEERGRPEAAAAAFERALALRPSLRDARVRLGRLLLASGRAEAAARVLEPARADAPRSLALRALLAQAYEAAGRLAEAEREWVAISRLYPKNPYHLERLARFYERTGEVAKARRVRRRADALSGRKRRRLRPLPKSRR